MNVKDMKAEIASTSYPGRGILLGRSEDGKKAVIAYFIMGRSANSRNRVFEAMGDDLRTRAFDESKMEDPSLVIYNAVRVLGDTTIVTNGDQTDTIYDFLAEGKTWEEALRTRTFEPDGPNLLPAFPASSATKRVHTASRSSRATTATRPRPSASSMSMRSEGRRGPFHPHLYGRRQSASVLRGRAYARDGARRSCSVYGGRVAVA